MARALVDCHACACFIAVEDRACPFCGASQHRTGAPLWVAASLLCGLGLAELACDPRQADAPPLLREQFGASSGTTGTTGTTTTTGTSGSTGSTGSTTIDDSNSNSNGDGTTYAGPDETWTSGGTTWTNPDGTTTTSTSADGTTYAGPDETTTIPTTNASTSADGTTHAGPDETSTTIPEPLTTAATADPSSGTGESGEPQPIDKDGCGCTSRTRPSSDLLALLGLLVLRRRRSRSR